MIELDRNLYHLNSQVELGECDSSQNLSFLVEQYVFKSLSTISDLD